MFTGLIEEIGTIKSVRGGGAYRRIEIEAPGLAQATTVGASVAVDGVCQTVTGFGSGSFLIDSLAETLAKTTFGDYRPGRRVNLEQAMRLGDRLDGHLVQGHVNASARISSIERRAENIFLSLELSPAVLRYCVAEGSIAVDGISLTVAAVENGGVRLNIIPETWKATVLADRRVGERVNIESDIIGRYLERLVVGAPLRSALDRSVLERYGFA